MDEHHWGLIEFPHIGEKHRGFLVPAEKATGVPFPIARAYWIHHWDRGHPRGGHAHRRIQQLFFCLQGEVEIYVRFGDGPVSSYRLEQPHEGLWTGPLVWLSMVPKSCDTILLVLASGPHDEGEYIREWEEYQRLFTPTRRPALVAV
jgi:hypothetical protein